MQATSTGQPQAAPAPTTTAEHGFAAFGISGPVVQALKMRGIDGRVRDPGRSSSADALAGRDVLARSRTGSGKTLAFAVPDRRAAHARAATARRR